MLCIACKDSVLIQQCMSRNIEGCLFCTRWMNAMPKGRQSLVRELFFSNDLPKEKLQRYHQKIKQQRSILPINGRELTDVCLQCSIYEQHSMQK